MDRKPGTPIGSAQDDDDDFKSDCEGGAKAHVDGTGDLVEKLEPAKDVVSHIYQLAVGGEYYGDKTATRTSK